MVKNMEVPEKKNPVERLMSLFSEVRAEEVTSALLLALTIFLLLGAYYILKPVREALILSEQGAEIKSYSAAGQAVLLLGLVPLYGWVASKVSRIRLLSGLTLFFVAASVDYHLVGGSHLGALTGRGAVDTTWRHLDDFLAAEDPLREPAVAAEPVLSQTA